MTKLKVPRDPGDLEAQLEEQLRFLESSAAAFDAGEAAEAKRIALATRLLLHDHGQSKSLLGQLGRKVTTRFWDSAQPRHPDDLSGIYHGLIGMWVPSGSDTGPGFDYLAPLDTLPPEIGRYVEFDTWWNAPVFVVGNDVSISRADLVLAVANTDGGAHVDAALDRAYAALSRKNALGFTAHYGVAVRACGAPHLAAVRQIAHEILKALRPGYRKVSQQPRRPGAVFSGLTVTLADPATPPAQRPDAWCACGSGMRYAICHGRQR